MSYRAELAHQVMLRLEGLDASAWDDAIQRQRERRDFHEMACRLAEPAGEILAEEFGAELVSVVRARLSDVDLIMPPLTDPRNTVARGAVMAAFLKDSHGFSVGAFTELFRPLIPHIDFAELERLARSAQGGDVAPGSVGDSVTPPAPRINRSA